LLAPGFRGTTFESDRPHPRRRPLLPLPHLAHAAVAPLVGRARRQLRDAEPQHRGRAEARSHLRPRPQLRRGLGLRRAHRHQRVRVPRHGPEETEDHRRPGRPGQRPRHPARGQGGGTGGLRLGQPRGAAGTRREGRGDAARVRDQAPRPAHHRRRRALAPALPARIAQAHAQELEKTLEELRWTQTQLIQTEKLSSLGQMLAGVAHEINNPVGFIFGNLTYIDDYVKDLLNLIQTYQETYPEPNQIIQETLEAIDFDFVQEDLLNTLRSTRVGVERIVQIVLSLRNFSRHDHTEMKPSNLHEGMDSTLLILGHRLKQGIEVTKNYSDLPLVTCYQAQLNQVFMNILNNAIDALMEQEQTDKHIAIQTVCLGNDRIEIRIQDNGPGMTYEVQTKLFDPFFTTKPVGKGTGLGLSICQQIIKNHQGSLRLVSSLGQGTEFIIQLPVYPAAA